MLHYIEKYVANYTLVRSLFIPTIGEDESCTKVYVKACLGDCTYNM